MMALDGRMLLRQLYFAAVVLATTSSLMLATVAQAPAPPECKESCGGVPIPYPFGLTDGCYLVVPGDSSMQFKLACDNNTLSFMDSYNYPGSISNILTGESALQIMVETARNCYNGSSYNSTLHRASYIYLPPSYTLAEKNKLYNIGCNKATKLIGTSLNVSKEISPDIPYEVAISGVSLCQDEFGKKFPDTCTGFGCSLNSIPSGIQNATVDVWTLGTAFGTTEQWGIDYPCSYGFVVDERNFTFAGNQSFDDLNLNRQDLPVLADWAIGNDNCEQAKKKNETAFACIGVNSECVDHDPGYFCKCLNGYAGNPYLLNDCTDVDECKNNSTLCSGPATCVNSIGSYKCKCHTGYRSDDHDLNKCVKIIETSSKSGTEMKVALGVSLSFLVLLSITFVIYHILKKRKFKQLCERYAKENGGTLIAEELKKYERLGYKAPRTFKLHDLNKATNDFHNSKIIGDGSFGVVYEGKILPDNEVVAIKKAKGDPPNMTPESRQAHAKQFINEMIVLSAIKHRNVVTLVGFCLETKTPILVYELVSNGTLHQHIHRLPLKNKGIPPMLSFVQRIRIASETAASLAFLHYGAFNTPIVHRDVKTSNILLDKNLTAKVSDFGASKLIPEDQTTQVATLVQGTLGYLDPAYLQTYLMTEKSDVYSFGVVLVEMLTSQMATDPRRKLEVDKNLSYRFLMSLKEGRLDEILDPEIIDEESLEIAEQVGKLAQRCLSLAGDDRPTMKEVEAELQAILTLMSDEGAAGKPKASHKETDYLLAASPSNAFVVDIRSHEGEAIRSIDYDKSMQNQAQMMKPNFDGGR